MIDFLGINHRTSLIIISFIGKYCQAKQIILDTWKEATKLIKTYFWGRK